MEILKLSKNPKKKFFDESKFETEHHHQHRESKYFKSYSTEVPTASCPFQVATLPNIFLYIRNITFIISQGKM